MAPPPPTLSGAPTTAPSAYLWLRDRGLKRLARLTEWRPVYGLLKLALELTLPVVAWAGLGEALRIGVRPQ